MHHLDSWIKRDQLDVTCFIISLFNAQHVSDVNTSETCWALNNEIIKQVTSSWSLFIQHVSVFSLSNTGRIRSNLNILLKRHSCLSTRSPIVRFVPCLAQYSTWDFFRIRVGLANLIKFFVGYIVTFLLPVPFCLWIPANWLGISWYVYKPSAY